MKILLNVMLVVSALTELQAAAFLILGPAGLSSAGSGEMWSMHYGFAVLAVASVSAWSWPHRNELLVMKTVIGILLVFHVGLCISLFLAGDQFVGMLIHALIGAMCIVLFFNHRSLNKPI
tara:strand:- start:606 stop:965 length:360 start_codon:yes stop_codon:yes gene_type:complete